MPIFIPEHIRNLKPYRAGKSIGELKRERGLKKIVKLASNENPLGPSPLGMQAGRKALRNAHRYPDPKCPELVHALAKHFGRSSEEFICASGIDSLINVAIAALSCEGDEIITSASSFIGIPVNA